ncbi:hypothetical protein AAFF_G00234120 [Aldrovandia affinis]|uniref:Uncharacterized protein n=1 Tax=Aldrovandia affinis TaxID=143900 RepID=A0AAD7RF34_9TELE|nr:hypothetical protein AAFF_G00234120 [Aldrovandia affinis]
MHLSVISPRGADPVALRAVRTAGRLSGLCPGLLRKTCCEYHTPGIELCCVMSRAMEKLLFLLVLLTGSYCHTKAEDLSGKVLVFPRRSDFDSVELIPSHYDSGLDAMTICLQFFSGDKDNRKHVIFSMGNRHNHEIPRLYKYADREASCPAPLPQQRETTLSSTGRDLRP